MTARSHTHPAAPIRLRYRVHESPTAIPPLSSFSRPRGSQPPDAPSLDPDDELVPILSGDGRSRASAGPMLRRDSGERVELMVIDDRAAAHLPRGIFFSIPTAPIPVPVVDGAPAAIDASRWNMGTEERGYLAKVFTGRGPKRGALAGVVSVVLVAPTIGLPAEARAGAGQAHSTGSPALLRMRGDADGGTSDVHRRAAATIADAVTAGVPEQVWAASVNRRVELRFTTGAVLACTVIAHDAATVTVSPEGGGAITVYSKLDIFEVRAPQGATPAPGTAPGTAPASSDKMPKSGAGMIVTGAILTGLGAPLFITGVVFLGIGVSYYKIWAPTLGVGIGLMAPGIPILASGAAQQRRHKAWKEAHGQAYLTPGVSRTRDGTWTGSLRLRF